MKRAVAIGLACACLGAWVVASPNAASKDVDGVFKAFFDARSPEDAARLVPDLVASGVSFDDAVRRLREGRTYSANAPKGVVRSSRTAHGREFFYSVNVPANYDPARRYQVRIQLHGGVGRPSNQPRGDGSIGSLAGAEQIYILPTGWEDAAWWDDLQRENIRAILDTVKRTYNVDENRVVLSGVSDGGTGVYYIAMRDTTPYASFLPLNGFIMVLRSVDAGDLFPNNLQNKPFFVVNGGMDPLYPTSIVSPYVEHLKDHGVELVYQPQPNAGHNTAWWPDVKDSYETFVRNHPRRPLPDQLTWESRAVPADNRADWLVIDRLSVPVRGEAALPDLNRIGQVGQLMFANKHQSGRVDLTRTGNTVKATTRGVSSFTLLLSPDQFDFSRPVRVETNGRVAFEGPIEKSVGTLAKWAARDNDRTMLYGAEISVTVH
jgi:predicted esterase